MEKHNIWHICNYSGGGNKNDPTLYDGRNLADIFNAEIAHYSSPWIWMQDRIDIRCYTGLNDCDFIPMTVDGETHEMQIAGINTYKGTTDQNLDDHIDFISRDCYSETVQWNLTNNNNGTAEIPRVYLASNIYKFLNEDLYNKLPADVKSVITPKRTLLEHRYSASGMLTETTGWGWDNLGKLWIPSEYEVFGSVIWGTKGWGAGQAVQYPIFANSWKNRIKGAGMGGARCDWWLLTVGANNSVSVCGISAHGMVSRYNTSDAFRVPICFRIKKS